MFESILTITIFVIGIFTPVLIPAAVHAVHFAREWRPARPALAPLWLRMRLPAPSRRVAAPAMG